MVARDGTGSAIGRSVTSCAECLAWGMTYAQGVCLACYNFAGRYDVGLCAACQRWLPLKSGYCRSCWCQAREDRAMAADNPRAVVVLAPYLSMVRYHQLFFAGMIRRVAQPSAFARRYGTRGRPHKPPPPVALRPPSVGAQLVLFNDLPRSYRYGRVDLRSGATPNNPWLMWGLHLASTLSEARGFDSKVRRQLNRNLVMVLSTHAEGERVRASDFHRVITARSGSLVHVIDILSTMGILIDDRTPVFDTWLASKVDNLSPSIAQHVRRWAYLLRDGSTRRRPRNPATAIAYVNAVRPSLLVWSDSYDHLREVTRDDIVTYLDALRGDPRMMALVALRSLFRWAKRDGVVFGNPVVRVRLGQRPRRIWQPLTDDEITSTVQAAHTPQARLCVALAAIHAARPGQIRALQLDDIDLGNRRLTIAGRERPLDELTCRVLTEWLDHRRHRWPHTANPHLLVSKESALRFGPVSASYIPDLRGQPANLERLRITRQLEEALMTGADPRHLTAVFGIAEATAIRYATNARQLLDSDHSDASSDWLGTRGLDGHDGPDEPLGSR